jgi:hypothetical protein
LEKIKVNTHHKLQNMKTLLIIISIIGGIALLGWLGFQFKPKPFSPYPESAPELKTIPLPAGLPAAVEQFYKTVYGDQIPVIETVLIKGRGTMAPFGLKMPARFVFVHNAGKDYRHYFEATFFGLPIMKVNENYLDGKSYFQLPVATYENDASTNQGANLALWAEAAWFPSIWLTDSRVRWEAVDDRTALLFVPFGEKQENFVVRFNPETNLLDSMEAMRYRDPGDQAKKILWITRNVDGDTIPGTPFSNTGSATWLDQGIPWATFTLEEVKYNVDISQYIRQRGN